MWCSLFTSSTKTSKTSEGRSSTFRVWGSGCVFPLVFFCFFYSQFFVFFLLLFVFFTCVSFDVFRVFFDVFFFSFSLL